VTKIPRLRFPGGAALESADLTKETVAMKPLHAFVAAAVALAAAPAAAQNLETPAPSPKARVEQRVGVTDFKLDYSSPSVKKRKIWGELVPYDKVWRMGANAATKLEVSRDFTFGDKPVKAGAYALYAIPGKTSWTLVLNSNPAGNATEPDAKTDVARITVKPTALPAPRERMTFVFSDTADDSTNLDLEWEKLRVRVPLKVDTKAHVGKGIEEATAGAWRPHWQAARYLLDSNGDLGQALAFIDKSVAIQPTWANNWVRAQILGKQGKKPEAKAAAEQALTLGKGDKVFEDFFKADIEKAAAGWK
jgi:hypothetical protein